MRIIPHALTDRGSRYAVSGGPVASVAEAKAFVKTLCRNKKFAKATHNTWAVLLPTGPVKNDDGEAGAGTVINAGTRGAGGPHHRRDPLVRRGASGRRPIQAGAGRGAGLFG